MRTLEFPEDKGYEFVEKDITQRDGTKKRYKGYEYKGTFGAGKVMGLVELIWSGIVNSQKADLTKKDHKINKRLKAKLKEITRYKDADEDSRIQKEGAQKLVLEEDEYNILRDLLDANKWGSVISDEVTDMWEFLDNVPEKKLEAAKT